MVQPSIMYGTCVYCPVCPSIQMKGAKRKLSEGTGSQETLDPGCDYI